MKSVGVIGGLGPETTAEFYLEVVFGCQKISQLYRPSIVDFIVMPCNSLHVFIKEIREAVNIPVLSIVEETIKYIRNNKFKRVGLISTSITVENQVYEESFKKENIDYIIPNELQRAEMNKIIYRLVNGVHLNRDREIVMSVINDLKESGVDAIALACTDLQLLLPSDDEIAVFDTMKVLTNATISEITNLDDF